MPPNFPRTTQDNRDLLRHTPLPSTYRTIRPNPTTTPITARPLTAFRIQRRSGMASPGLRSVSLWHHQRLYQRHPCRPPSADQSLRPYLHPRLHRHRRPRPSVYMRRPPNHIPVQRRGEPQEHPRPLIRLPNPSASRGRKRSPFLGIPHRWRRQLRWILISGRHALIFLHDRVSTDGIDHLYAFVCMCSTHSS